MEATAAAARAAGEIVLALDGRSAPFQAAAAERLESELRRRFPDRGASVLVSRWQAGEVSLVPAAEAAAAVAAGGEPTSPHALSRGGISGAESALRAALRAACDRDAAAVALIANAPHDPAVDWLGMLVGPVLDGGFELVRPIYRRPLTEGTLNTGLVYPLTRALYGWRLRQPVGGEVCLSAPMARRLLDDPDWRRDPARAGSDAWLVAKALAGGPRVCQAWLGAPPREAADGDDASHALARVLGPVFREMERHASRWQRVEGSRPLPTFGSGEPPPAEPARVHVEPLLDVFRLGQRDLAPLWALVLPPATLLPLRAAARAGAESFRVDDALWARIVYDFAVAHFVKTVERGQLLGAMTPLYLGWLAGFLRDKSDGDAAAAEARVEALCAAFEREKPYLIARWRWPEDFNP
jgi:hypothetical protein